MKYHLAIKKNKIPIHAMARMNLKNIMLSERSQVQKKQIQFQLQEVPRRVRFTQKIECWLPGAGAKGNKE